MHKKKKRKKGGHSNRGGGYKKFLLDLQEAVNQAALGVKVGKMPNEYKRMLYDYRIRVANPEAVNDLVSSRELNEITVKTKRYYRQKHIGARGSKHSTYQLMLLYCFSSVSLKMMKKDLGEKDPLIIQAKKVSDDAFKTFSNHFILDHFRIITQFSNPCYKYFGMHIRPAAVIKDNPMVELVIQIRGFPAQSLPMTIDHIKRPTFRLGSPAAGNSVEWISVDSSILGDYYTGTQPMLELYIQSHVIKRMSQRLDLLDQEAINYLIWDNTHTITEFVIHKGYLLLPVMLFDVKVGYLVARIVEDKILFRTFLFVTHSFTPEGDKLAEISGLGKHDITYWRIDRLSSFVNLDVTHNRALLELFQLSGIEDFMKLKEQDFDTDQMQSVNLDGLMDYIERSREMRRRTE